MGFFEFLFGSFVGVVVFIIIMASYFLPTIIALLRRQPNALAIFLLNFFLGWTFIGWVVALVWSVTK